MRTSSFRLVFSVALLLGLSVQAELLERFLERRSLELLLEGFYSPLDQRDLSGSSFSHGLHFLEENSKALRSIDNRFLQLVSKKPTKAEMLLREYAQSLLEEIFPPQPDHPFQSDRLR